MAATILDGKALAKTVRGELKAAVAARVAAGDRPPGLAVVLVGDDPASQIYVGKKEKTCKRLGFASRVLRLSGDTGQEALLAEVRNLVEDPAIDGILVQLPLPKGLDEDLVLAAIPPEKDVDGFHPRNLASLALGDEGVVACTPKGVIALLDSVGFEYQGAEAVVIGRSRIVGKPMAYLLTNRNATVTLCHSRTRALEAHVRRADLVVAAVGRKHLVKGAWIREGAAVIDVGIHRNDDGTLAGDVEFEAARTRAGSITPVPGGVGPMTIAMLLQNTFEAYERSLGGR